MAVPCGLWNLSQSTATQVDGGDTGIIDLTGGEAGPYGLVEGTSAEHGAPVRTSDSKVWNPFTPPAGGIAQRNHPAGPDYWLQLHSLHGRSSRRFGP